MPPNVYYISQLRFCQENKKNTYNFFLILTRESRSYPIFHTKIILHFHIFFADFFCNCKRKKNPTSKVHRKGLYVNSFFGLNCFKVQFVDITFTNCFKECPGIGDHFWMIFDFLGPFFSENNVLAHPSRDKTSCACALIVWLVLM